MNAAKPGVEVRCGEQVTGIAKGGAGFMITTESDTYSATKLVITTGGSSSPKTGSTGTGTVSLLPLASRYGDRTALAPLLVRPFPFAGLAGISFEGTRFTVWRDGKKVGDHTGDVLFTHLGLSGRISSMPRVRSGRRSGQALVRRDDEARGVRLDLAKVYAENTGWQVSTILAKYPIPERLNRKLLHSPGSRKN